MMKPFLSVFVLLAGLVLAGCSSDSDTFQPGPTPPSGSVNLGVIHASPDAPAVNVFVDGAPFTSGLSYKQSVFSAITPGDLSVEVEGVVPGGNTSVIGPVTIPANDGERLVVIAVDQVAQIAPLVIQESAASVGAGDVRVQVVHAAPAAPQVDVYVTSPGADLALEAPVGTFSFTEILGPLTVPAADYQIRITPAGDPATVAYDSGPVALAGGADLVVAAVENTGPGAAPVSLLVAGGATAIELLDVQTPATVRVVHASPDAPDVDVIAADDFANPVVAGLGFAQESATLPVPPGALNVKVVPAGADTPVVIDADLNLVASFEYSVLAVDFLSSIEPLVLVDDSRPVATEARLRVVHGAPTAGEVDVYLVAPGTDISTVAAALTNVPFKADSGYLSVPPGDYDVVVTPAADTMPAIGPVTVTLDAGGIYTAIARDEIGGGTPLGLILLDDF